MREKRLIGRLAASGQENGNNFPLRKDLILEVKIEVHREMPNLFGYIDGRIKESDTGLTESPRREDVKRIKKHPPKSLSVFIGAPVVEKTQPHCTSCGPIEFLQFLRKNSGIGEIHALVPIVDIRVGLRP